MSWRQHKAVLSRPHFVHLPFRGAGIDVRVLCHVCAQRGGFAGWWSHRALHAKTGAAERGSESESEDEEKTASLAVYRSSAGTPKPVRPPRGLVSTASEQRTPQRTELPVQPQPTSMHPQDLANMDMANGAFHMSQRHMSQRRWFAKVTTRTRS